MRVKTVLTTSKCEQGRELLYDSKNKTFILMSEQYLPINSDVKRSGSGVELQTPN